jgi:hypothetical protein
LKEVMLMLVFHLWRKPAAQLGEKLLSVKHWRQVQHGSYDCLLLLLMQENLRTGHLPGC